MRLFSAGICKRLFLVRADEPTLSSAWWKQKSTTRQGLCHINTFFTSWSYTECGIATANRPSVRPSVTLRYRGHKDWNISKMISWLA